MSWYCEKCKCLHNDTDLCPNLRKQLGQHPEWLSEAADFTAVVGQYHLITSNALDSVAQGVNHLVKSNLVYEGTHQFTRDIQVFKRLNTERFCKIGAFASPEAAKSYLENATPNQIKNLVGNINGSSQEIDWLRDMQGRISSLLQKSELFNKNAPGVDGVTCNRLTGKTISRTTIKASQSHSGINTNVQQIVEAIKLDRLNPDEVVYGVKGTKSCLSDKLEKEIQYALKNNNDALAERLAQAKKGLKVIEKNTTEQVAQNNKRIMDKIGAGKAATYIPAQEVAKKALNGAVIGAAVDFSIAGITNFVKFKNGEISLDEAITNTSEDTAKGAIIGASLSAVTLFLPAGPLGFLTGMAVGIYIDAVCSNILDEIYGKGAVGAILNSSGYVCGMAVSFQEKLKTINKNIQATDVNTAKAQEMVGNINRGFDEFERLKGE